MFNILWSQDQDIGNPVIDGVMRELVDNNIHRKWQATGASNSLAHQISQGLRHTSGTYQTYICYCRQNQAEVRHVGSCHHLKLLNPQKRSCPGTSQSSHLKLLV